jgi:hypothetical protein
MSDLDFPGGADPATGTDYGDGELWVVIAEKSIAG